VEGYVGAGFAEVADGVEHVFEVGELAEAYGCYGEEHFFSVECGDEWFCVVVAGGDWRNWR